MPRVGVHNMGYALWPLILSFALAMPSQDPPASSRTSCIRMTPEKEKQIDLIVEELEKCLKKISVEHGNFDIRLIKLSIEQHSKDEEEEKETVLQLSVNDCQLTDDEVEEIDHHKEKAKEYELEREKEKIAKEQKEKEKCKPDKESINQTAADTVKENEHDNETKKNFEVLYLDLDENGQKLDEALGKKRPKLVYVQEDRGQIDYWYLRRR